MIKSDWSFPKQVFFALLVAGCIGLYPLYVYDDNEITKAAIAGGMLSTLNVLLGYAAIEYSIQKSTATFFKYVFGGMGLRLFIMAIIFFLLLKVFSFHTVSLVTSMGILYAVFLIMEIIFIQKKINLKQQS